jgi:translocation and assembly module TamA
MDAGMRRDVRRAPTLLACALALACNAFFAPFCLAADPQPYRVEFVPTGRSTLDSTIKATSQLQTLRTSAPVNPYGLIARARGDIDRLNTVLESFGFYEGSVKVAIEGLALDAPNLGDTLTALPKGTDAHIKITLAPGPLFQIGSIKLMGDLPAGAKIDLATGTPAAASVVLAAGSQLQSRLQDQGYAFAVVDPPVAYEDPQKQVLNLEFKVTAGRRVDVGEIRFQGVKRTNESLLRRRLLLHTGEHYSAANVERARKDLLNLGIFASVSVRLGQTADSLGHVPVTFVVRERPRHAVGLTGSYSSDLGLSGGVTWSDRNIFGNGEELDLSGTMIDLGGTASEGLGYETSAKYILPDFGHRDQSLQFALSAIKQNLQAYDQTAETAGVTLNRKISSVWSVSVGVTAETEQIVQGGCIGNFPYQLASPDSCLSASELPDGETPPPLEPLSRDYTLFGLPLSLSYDSTNLASPLEDPLRGTRGALTLTPTLSLGRPNATFLITQASISHYIDLHDLIGTGPGRTVLALRALAGLAVGANEFSLPPDQRFYAGGSGTVRGYNYQSVGPQFTAPGGNPIGGTSMSAVNVELRQRIGENFGAAIFVDGGGVSESQSLLPASTGAHCVGPPAPNQARPAAAESGVFCLGVGTGIRYYTPIGPVRVDIAVPALRREDDSRFEFYIGLGQAF